MIDKETAIALAKEADAGFGRGAMPDSVVGIDAVVRLCNLAVAHEARDLALVQNLLKEYGLQALDVVEAFKAQKDAEPVAWIAKQEDGGLLLWDASYKLIQEGYDLGFNKNSRRLKYYPLYTHPTHDEVKDAVHQTDWTGTPEGWTSSPAPSQEDAELRREPTAVVCDCEGATDDDGRLLHYALLYLTHPLPPGTALYTKKETK